METMMNLTTEQFKELVAKDVRNECTEEEVLVLQNNIREWLKELNVLARDVDLQLAAQQARMAARQAELMETGSKIEWLFYKSEQGQWKVRTMRFKASVIEKIHDVKALRANMHMNQAA